MDNDDDEEDDALATGWLTEAIVVPVVGREIALVVLFEVFTCCCFGTVMFAAVGFVVVVCCCDGDIDDGSVDVGGVGAADDNKSGFTVFGIPHIRDSVVLTTLRPGLLGSHIFALSPGDIGLLDELLLRLPAAGDDEIDGICCANT
jgi:hypothetical protein